MEMDQEAAVGEKPTGIEMVLFSFNEFGSEGVNTWNLPVELLLLSFLS